MAKEIKFDIEARDALKRGVDPLDNAVKVTINEFRDKLYLHIREYSMDGDTGQWFPTKTGFSIPADEVSSLLPLLEEASELVAKRYIWNTQLELELE